MRGWEAGGVIDAQPHRRPLVVVTGALAPYTHLLYERLAGAIDRPLHVLACSGRETARHWDIPPPNNYRHAVLPGLRWHRSTVDNHYVNPGVALLLARMRPAAVVLNDFSPTMAVAALAARGLRIPHGVRTDGVPETDPGRRSPAHRALRRAVVAGAAFGLGPSRGSAELLAAYGLRTGTFRLAPLFPAWSPAIPPTGGDRPYDVLFCGVLDHRKGVDVFIDIVLACQARGRPLRVRVTGDGPMRAEMERRFAEAGVAARFDGFLQQGDLEAVYASAALFLFPTRADVWGIVVQEALQCGAVPIASPHSGVARELLAARGCGPVIDLDADLWADAVLSLLDDRPRRDALRGAGYRSLSDFSVDSAVSAYRDALAPILSRPAADA
ncbi:glycosyltransferase [Lichenibacterium minor]|uniref:Glycosyltransferase n=1 Tax=Lichenibacterium minor TaxID=2316528 RepID=A0A4Q2UAM0_9HYPH|nr:glycosyltransferase [Lichenibacterium minor]